MDVNRTAVVSQLETISHLICSTIDCFDLLAPYIFSLAFNVSAMAFISFQLREVLLLFFETKHRKLRALACFASVVSLIHTCMEFSRALKLFSVLGNFSVFQKPMLEDTMMIICSAVLAVQTQIYFMHKVFHLSLLTLEPSFKNNLLRGTISICLSACILLYAAAATLVGAELYIIKDKSQLIKHTEATRLFDYGVSLHFAFAIVIDIALCCLLLGQLRCTSKYVAKIRYAESTTEKLQKAAKLFIHSGVVVTIFQSIAMVIWYTNKRSATWSFALLTSLSKVYTITYLFSVASSKSLVGLPTLLGNYVDVNQSTKSTFKYRAKLSRKAETVVSLNLDYFKGAYEDSEEHDLSNRAATPRSVPAWRTSSRTFSAQNESADLFKELEGRKEASQRYDPLGVRVSRLTEGQANSYDTTTKLQTYRFGLCSHYSTASDTAASKSLAETPTNGSRFSDWSSSPRTERVDSNVLEVAQYNAFLSRRSGATLRSDA